MVSDFIVSMLIVFGVALAGIFIGGDAMRDYVIKECQNKQTVTLKGYKIYCSTRVIDF